MARYLLDMLTDMKKAITTILVFYRRNLLLTRVFLYDIIQVCFQVYLLKGVPGMAQISLYVDDSMAERLNVAAKACGCSVSKYVATLVDERLSEEDCNEARKKLLLRELRGSINDQSFLAPSDILMVAESERRYDLI